LVRSNKRKEIGFLKDWRRMNVAVTRARRMLVIIGNADCVSKDQYIGTLVEWIEKHGKTISALEF
jgi:ATP-dependent RNA/DNA helicase IGHMBP2